MGRFTHDGVIYEELSDGNVRVVGYSGQGSGQAGGTVVPSNPVLAGREAAKDKRDQIKTDILIADRDKPSAGYRWADPQHTRQEIIPGGPADTGGMVPDPATDGLSGEKFLQTLSTSERATVKALSDGRLAFPSGAGLRSPYWQRMLAAVAHYDPSFDAVNYNARAATRRDFTSGVSARNITAFNTALGHLGTLYEAAGELHNRSFTPWNAVANSVERTFGDPRVDKFNSARQAVVDELEKAFRGSNGTQAGIEEWKSALNSSQSPEQIRSVIGQMVDLLGSRVRALGEQYKQGMGRTVDGITLLDPHAQAVFSALAPGGNGKIGEAPSDNNPLHGGSGFPKGGPGGGGNDGAPGNGNGKPIIDVTGAGYGRNPALPQVVREGPFSTDDDRAYQQKLEQAYYAKASLDQLNQISRDAGRGELSDQWRQAVDSRNAGHPYGPGEPPKSGMAGVKEWAVGSPVGTAMTTYFNSAGVGLPELMTGHDAFDAMRTSNPWSAAAGDFAGSLAGSYGARRFMRGASGHVGNSSVARILANPMTGDALYSGVYGGNTSDNHLGGAAGGTALSVAGALLLGRAGRSLNALRAPSNPLSAGEQAVMNATNKSGVDDVLTSLRQADSLGIPATLADVSPEVNSLTGAAIRRSPTVAGQARDALIPRGRSQYDRFVGAVERDLGPVENIPQRSEDLIQQARTAAGPLYDAAYAAPGASVIDLSDLMARPSMGRALTNARRIAAEEGRDPDTLGIVLGPDGATTLNQPSWQTLDYVKRGLDDVLEGYRDPTTGRLALDTEGRAVNGTLKDLLSRLDQMNPDYAAARAAYAGPASETSALRMGQRSASMTPDQLAVNTGRASPSQMDQMRLGFQSQLAENAGKMRYNTNPFESTLGTPAMEQRLATMYPDQPQGVAQLLAQAEMERNLAASSNRLIGNSMTAERGIADQAFDGPGWVGPVAEAGVETALMGAPVMTGLRRLGGQRLADTVRMGMGKRAEAKAADVAGVSLNPSPRETIAQILQMQAQQAGRSAVVDALMTSGQNRGQRVGTSVAAALMPYVMGN